MGKYKSKILNEELTSEEVLKIRTLIRKEVAKIFFDLYRKKSTWSN
jgi:ubiquitin